MNSTTTPSDSCQANLKSAKLTISLTLIIPGIVINISVIAALLRKAPSLNGFSLLVVHLAFADLTVFFTATPFLMLSAENPQLAFTAAVCKGTAFFNRLTTISSILILTAMAGCRFYSITKPFSYRVHVRSSRINIACGLLWIFSLALSITPFLGWGEYEQIKGQCWCALDSAKHNSNYITVLVIAFCLPTALNCYFLVGIMVAMRNSRKTATQKLNQTQDEPKTNVQAADEVKQPKSSEHLEELELNLCKVEPHLERSLKNRQDVDSNEPVTLPNDVFPNVKTISLEPVMTPTTSTFTVRKSFFLARKSKQSYDLENAGNCKQESRENVSQSDTNETDETKQKSHQQVKPALENDAKLKHHQNANNKKAFYILIFLFFAYIACCGPTYFIWSWYAFSDSLPSKPPRALFAIFRAMAGAQSVANSLIYGIRHEDIRKKVFKLWKDIAIYAKSKILNLIHVMLQSRNES